MHPRIRIIITVLVVGFLSGTLFIHAQTPAPGATAQASPAGYTDLQKRIEERTAELTQINQKLDEVEKNLKETQGQSVSLSKQVKTLDYSISQLNLNIKADSLTAERLGFEIESLEYDLDSIEKSMQNKREVIGNLIQELYKNDQKNIIVVLLENKSLAESLAEVESMGSVREQLATDIENLLELSQNYGQKLGEVKDKRVETVQRQQNLTYRKGIVEDQKKEQQTLLVQTKSKEATYQEELAKLQKQQDSISDEISRFEDQLRASFDPTLLPTKRPGVFAWPLTTKKITQHFGEVSRLYKGKPHNGLDLGTPLGTPVFAAEDGTVFAVDNNDRSTWAKYQYGKYILIKHNNNLATLYAHLSRQAVREGELVTRGQLIGYSGNTGYSTGAHLHFGVYWSPSILLKAVPPATGLVPVGVVINPEDYL